MIALGWTVDLYQQASASMVRISELLQRRPTVADPPESLPAPPIAGAIEFRDVGIRFQRSLAHATAGTVAVHDDRDWVLRHVSFSVPQGTSLAIVGATGIGKTTLVNLLARVRDPDEGQVLVDGRDVRVLPLANLRRAIGYVPQDTFLFSVPLKENVTFGKPDAEIDAIERALRISRLSNDLIQFPNGIETLIGERGVTLSGGQKQRTAIARAVLRDPAILVLDDALSSVDAHTAAEILAELRNVMRGRTSLIIAQRIATVKDADQVIVLHAGGIAEQGTHRDLLRSNGLYAAMYRRELIQSELEGEVGVQH
jgi:ATP-binding cassette subfamily B protein